MTSVCVCGSLLTSQGHSVPGGLGVCKVWNGAVLQDPGPLCAAVAGVCGKNGLHTAVMFK